MGSPRLPWFPLPQFPWSPPSPFHEAVCRSAGVKPGWAVITVQNAEQMLASWGLGAARWTWLPEAQEPPSPPLSWRNQAPWAIIPELSCPLNSPLQAGWAEAYRKEAVSGQAVLCGAGVKGAGHN